MHCSAPESVHAVARFPRQPWSDHQTILLHLFWHYTNTYPIYITWAKVVCLYLLHLLTWTWLLSSMWPAAVELWALSFLCMWDTHDLSLWITVWCFINCIVANGTTAVAASWEERGNSFWTRSERSYCTSVSLCGSREQWHPKHVNENTCECERRINGPTHVCTVYI